MWIFCSIFTKLSVPSHLHDFLRWEMFYQQFGCSDSEHHLKRLHGYSWKSVGVNCVFDCRIKCEFSLTKGANRQRTTHRGHSKALTSADCVLTFVNYCFSCNKWLPIWFWLGWTWIQSFSKFYFSCYWALGASFLPCFCLLTSQSKGGSQSQQHVFHSTFARKAIINILLQLSSLLYV